MLPTPMYLTVLTRQPPYLSLHIQVPGNCHILAIGTCRLNNSGCHCHLDQAPRMARHGHLPDFHRTVPAPVAGR
jgi:hypothetical protein